MKDPVRWITCVLVLLFFRVLNSSLVLKTIPIFTRILLTTNIINQKILKQVDLALKNFNLIENIHELVWISFKTIKW